MKVHKGDTVIVISGKDKGAKGKVLVAYPDRDTEPEAERHGQNEQGTASAGEGKPSAASAINPYRSDSFLWRIHAVSALLVVPQFAFSTYGLVWLIVVQGIGAGAAGAIVAIAQIIGAVGRMVVGALIGVGAGADLDEPAAVGQHRL